MNNDLANFIVEFTTKGLQDVKDGIKDLGNKIDDVSKKFKEADKSSSSFFNGLKSIETKLLAIGTAVGGLGLKKAFDIKNESLELQRFSAETGIAAQNIEALGLALKFNGFGGDKSTANGFFNTLVDMRAKWRRGEIGKDQIEEMARAGFTIDPNAGIEQWILKLSDALHKQTDAGQRNLLANAFGLDRAMKLYLSEGADYVMNTLKEAGAETWLYQPDVARQSAELNKNWEKFKNNFNKMFSDEWLTTTNDLVKVLQDLEPNIGKMINYIGGEFGESIRAIGEFVKVFNGEKSFGDLAEEMKQNREMAEGIGGVIGMAIGGIIGALLGHPVLGALIGRAIGSGIGGKITDASNKEYVEFDWEKWRNGEPQDLQKLPTKWYAGMSMDMLNKINANTYNIKIDPTKTGEMTFNADGTVTTKDGRGMTIIGGIK